MSSITSEVVGRWARVVLSGEFDFSNSAEISNEIERLVAEGVTDLTVDLEEVKFFDVSAINSLVVCNIALSSVAGRMILLGASELTRRILELVALAAALHPFAPLLRSGDARSDERVAMESCSTSETDGTAFTDDFYALSALLLADTTLSGDLRQLVHTAVDVLPDCDAASIALLAEGASRTAASSSHIAIEVDVAQYVTFEGPCLDAAATGQRVRVDVLDADERFKHFAVLALEADVQTTFSMPITIRGCPVGSLNLYSTQPRAFGDGTSTVAEVLAAQAATAIHRSVLYDAARRLVDRIEEYSNRRAEVAQAEGALSVLASCSLEQAQVMLRSAAQVNHAGLLQAARDLIDQLRAGLPRED